MRKLLFLSLILCKFSLLNGFAQAGTFDSNFDADGLTSFEFVPGTNNCYGVTVAPDGKIIMAGYIGSFADPYFALARLNPDGSLDNTFSSDGKTTTDIFDKSIAYEVALQSDGKILVAGRASMNSDNLDWFAVARYNTNGSLDNSFNSDGVATIFFGESNDVAYSIAVQADEKIVVAGRSSASITGDDFALARFNTDGSLDNTFSFDGKVTTDFNSGNDMIYSIIIQPDGKILAAGFATNSTIDFALARYNADGSLDNTFSSDGKVTIDVSPSIDKVSQVMLLPDGKILLTGNSRNATNLDIAIVRLNADGSLDNTFSTDGIIIHNPTLDEEYVDAGALQVDGKILVSGFSPHYTGRAYVARFNSDGSFDDTFANNGILEAPLGYEGAFAALALQSDYKIIAAGYNLNGGTQFFAARILSGLNVGVLEFSDNTNALIYPNPVNEITVLAFELSTNQTLSISICDAQGRTVQTLCGKKFFTEGKHEISIDAGQLAAGQYILVLDNGKGKTSVRFQK